MFYHALIKLSDGRIENYFNRRSLDEYLEIGEILQSWTSKDRYVCYM